MKYRKCPVIIEAEVYRRGLEDGFECCEIFSGKYLGYFPKGTAIPKVNQYPVIETLEGRMRISEGDFIITGVKGERYPCKPEIFHMTYEEVKE